MTLALGALIALIVFVALADGSSQRSGRAARQDRDRAAATAAPAPLLRRFTIGRSVQGRRIDAFERAAPGPTAALLVVGCIDGNEPAGIAIARGLMAATPPPRSALWIVPTSTPTASPQTPA